MKAMKLYPSTCTTMRSIMLTPPMSATTAPRPMCEKNLSGERPCYPATPLPCSTPMCEKNLSGSASGPEANL